MVSQTDRNKAIIGDLDNATGFRRLRLGGKGTVGEQVEYQAEIDFATGGVVLRDTYIGVKKLPVVNEVRVGYFREPFSLEQSELLLRSVFGDAGRLPTLNERLFALAGGNPRWTMALCEHLVDSGLARYEAGGWRLPVEIGSGDLPQSLAADSLARIAALPSDAHELADLDVPEDPASQVRVGGGRRGDDAGRAREG